MRAPWCPQMAVEDLNSPLSPCIQLRLEPYPMLRQNVRPIHSKLRATDSGGSLTKDTLLRFLLGMLVVALFLQRLADLLRVVLAR
jgi:hypothetical protein